MIARRGYGTNRRAEYPACRGSNDSRQDQLRSAGYPGRGPEGVEKRVAKSACLSIRKRRFFCSPRGVPAPTPRPPKPPVTSWPRSGRTDRRADRVSPGQLLDRQQRAVAEVGCLRVFARPGRHAGTLDGAAGPGFARMKMSIMAFRRCRRRQLRSVADRYLVTTPALCATRRRYRCSR
jgi:hypothetical protein